MYTKHYDGLTIFGGLHHWSIIDPDGIVICTVCSTFSDSTQPDELLKRLNRVENKPE